MTSSACSREVAPISMCRSVSSGRGRSRICSGGSRLRAIAPGMGPLRPSSAGDCVRLVNAERTDNPPLLHPRPERVVFVSEHMAVTTIDTDLVTPLAAYLRLRESGRASFLLESVDQGRLGRHSFVGCGERIVSFEEAEELGEAVVGYLGYDHIAKLERTVPLPDDGPDVPESRFVVADLFLRFDHVTGTADVLVGDSETVARILARPVEQRPEAPVRAGETVRFPDRDEHLRRVEVVQEHIRRGDVFQLVLSQRAERETTVSPLA